MVFEMDFKALSKKIGDKLKTIPSLWNSQTAVLELSAECYPMWEQSEWLDFYFSYLCEKHLPDFIPINEKVCGTTFFDGIKDFVPDFEESLSGKTKNGKAEQKKSLIPSRDFDIAYKNYQHWRQMEWIESYFNYLCEKKLTQILQIPGPSCNKMHFNGLLEIPWIFKTYIENTGNKKIILADADLITQGLKDFENIGVIISSGFIEYPDNKTATNGKNNKIYKDKIAMMKELRQHTIFNVKDIYFLPFSADLVSKCETFQPGGTKKEHLSEKILIDIGDIINQSQYSLNFDNK